jgi:RecA/RadA recombinase
MSIFNQLIDVTKNEYAAIADEGITAGDVAGFVDTGAYALNALFSGSIYGGIPSNKVTAFAGEPAAGKTFFTINAVKEFLRTYPDGFVFYFESESAISKQMLADRDVDTKRVVIVPVATVQEFRTQAIKVLDKYMDSEKEGKKKVELPKMMFILDSLGNLSTTKEIEDMESGSEKRDMTRAQLIRGAFRVLTLKLGKAQVPLIVTNHISSTIGTYVPAKEMGGGEGLKYAASTIAFLTKKKDRDEKTKSVTGVLITVELKKSRLTIENKKVTVLLNYDTGLDRYYGLLPLAEKYGIIKKVSTKYEFPDGTKEFESKIDANPEKYFTKDILDKIDAICKTEFMYGAGGDYVEEEEIIAEPQLLTETAE